MKRLTFEQHLSNLIDANVDLAMHLTGAIRFGSLKVRRLNRAELLPKLCNARFKRRTFDEPNLIAPIKNMTRSTFESIKFDKCYLGRPDLNVELFHVPNQMHNFTQKSARSPYLSCRHICNVCTAWPNKMAGRAGRNVFLLLREHHTYLLDVHKPLLYAVFRI